jgi:hypothetical protein
MISPNYTPSLIRHDLFVFHRSEGNYDGGRAWLCDPRAKASATMFLRIDGKEITQLVEARYKAWAQCAFNSFGPSMEIEGRSADGMPDITRDAAALVAAWFCRAYAMPPQWARGGQGRGLVQHHDLGAAGGGHVDCSGVGSPEWLSLVAATQNAYDALGKLTTLPDFALHGAPGPHQVVPTPDVDPEPSHNGAPRCEAGDTHSHPTPSGFPAHSIAALQADLNKLMSAGLVVDGRYGALTATAVRRFQVNHGCNDDGVPGSQTWRALDAAMGV